MKRILNGILIFLICLPLNHGFAQKCKPDAQIKDKITKKLTTAWMFEVVKPGFEDAVIDRLDNNTSNIFITMIVCRSGDENFIQFAIRKTEASLQSANLESTLKAEKGDELLVGFKEANPISFIATGVQNSTKMDNVSNVLVTTVSFDCKISDNDLNVLDQLAANPITTLRFKFKNGVIIEKDVREKNGKKMMERITCALTYFKENGYYK